MNPVEVAIQIRRRADRGMCILAELGMADRQDEAHVVGPDRRTLLPRGHVYFLRAWPSMVVKIGFAGDVVARICDAQTFNHQELRLVGALIGCQLYERRLHQRFAHRRVRGEWFAPDEDLLAVMQCMQRWHNDTGWDWT